MFNEKPVTITIDPEKCTKCDICAGICPIYRVFGYKDLAGKKAGEICISCGNCLAICPTGAIAIEGLGMTEPLGEFPTADRMLNLVKGRRTVRSFKKTAVKKEHWEKLIEAVKYSPTGHNAQYVDLVVIESPEILKKVSEIGMEMSRKFKSRLTNPVTRKIYRRILGDHTVEVFYKGALFWDEQLEYFEQGNDPILFDAPALMLFIAPSKEFMNKNDCDLAAQTVALLAPTLGLGSCYSGIVTAAFGGVYPGIKKIIPIPEGFGVYNALIIGYPKYQYRAVSPRKERNTSFI